MNALDALFSRQVPTRSPNASSNAGARQQGSGQTESFASALSSGRPDKPEPRARQADDKAPARDDSVDDTRRAEASEDREIDETDQPDDTEDSQTIDLLALLAKRAENNQDNTDEDGEDEIVIEVVEEAADDELVLDEDALSVMQQTEKDNNGVDGKTVAAAAIAEGNPRATIIAQQNKPVTGNANKGEAAQANAANGAADGAKIAGVAVAGGGKSSDDAGADAGKEGHSKGEADMAELDPTLRSKSASIRGEGDIAMEKVEVLEKRSVSGMSANADNVAKALVRDASGLNTQATSETADAAALRQAAPAERANAAAMAPRTGQTLHTLRIQLNPESLGQVTAIMRLSDGELKVELKVQSAEAYRQLTDDSSAIAKALRQQGYGIDQITVQQTNAGSDKSGMNAQQGQTSSQQFQFREGMAQNSSGGNGGEGRGRSPGGQNGGEVGHEVVSGNASSTGASDGVYL